MRRRTDHSPPGVDCRCGLYGWYLPGSATVSLGPASAVIAARGPCVLADRGFRAAEARVEAVALPAAVRWNPRAASRARRMLAEQYPRARVYGSPWPGKPGGLVWLIAQLLRLQVPHPAAAEGGHR